MKKIFALLLFSLSTLASAEICTAVIKDMQNGYEYESFTRQGYSMPAACDQASYECNDALSRAQSYGRYYGAQCIVKFNPNPYPRQVVCQTDMVNQWNETQRIFTAPGQSPSDACYQSDSLCKMALARSGGFGYRCVNQGIINDRPNRTKTENCTVNRLDPAGMFIQSYFATATGPIFSDVKGQACNRAMNDCSYQLRGRQFCQIAY
jgi:hypothetical protein